MGGLRKVLIGEGGANMKHIQEECKAKVNVRDENGEMRIEIGADSQDALRKADAMVKDLIGVAYTDYETWKATQGKDSRRDRDTRDSKGGKGKGKRNKRDDIDERPRKVRR